MAKSSNKAIGLLGGSFDPVHKGHLTISKIALKKIKISLIYWLITKKNPFKKNVHFSLKYRIKLAKKYANKRAALKKIIKNKKLELSERFAAQLKLNKLPKNSSKIRIRNRCEVSGRPHGVYRKLKISRIALRDMASSGKIPGITKSSW